MTAAINHNIPVEYKQTEIGMIPVDWDVRRLGDLGVFKGGSGFPLKYQGKVDGKYPFYKVSDMNNVGNQIFMYDSNNWVSEITRKEMNFVIFPAHSIVFAKIGAAIYLERKKILSHNSCMDNNMMGFIFNENQIDYRFLHYLFLQIQLGKLVSATALPSINGKQIAELTFAFPEKIEQTAIAIVLSDIDSLIEKLEKLIEKKKKIKQGSMQELLTGKRRLPEFSGKWNLKELGKVLKVKHGKSQKAVAVANGKYPILATGGEIGRTNTYLCNKPSVLIGRKGTIDVPQYMDTPFWTVDTLFYTEIENGNDAKFLFYKFQLIDWYSYNEASGVPSLNAKTIERIEAYLSCDESEQRAIAEVLSDMDSEIEKLESELNKYKNVKQGMMQNLLTGKIRLIKK